jgi:hypothetical protein
MCQEQYVAIPIPGESLLAGRDAPGLLLQRRSISVRQPATCGGLWHQRRICGGYADPQLPVLCDHGAEKNAKSSFICFVFPVFSRRDYFAGTGSVKTLWADLMIIP